MWIGDDICLTFNCGTFNSHASVVSKPRDKIPINKESTWYDNKRYVDFAACKSWNYRVRQYSSPLSFLLFSQQSLGILIWNFTVYLQTCFTSKCRVKCDFVEKRRSCKFFNVTTYRFSSDKNVQATTPI